LIAVWTTWQSSVTLTATVADGFGNYASAVGPTQQPTQASGVPANAQIFYLKTTGTGGIMDTVTVTLTGPSGTPVPSFGMVMAEYSGLDTLNPLDSVSEAISNSGSPSGTLDSGTTSPANANLLVFGGGDSDNGSATTAVPWTTIQSNLGNITEYQILTGNNTLQRATAGLSPLPTTGNWLMQMAVFRAASWTVAQGASPTRTHGVLYADQFPGTDIGARINNAYAACPASGCHIKVPAGSYSFTTPIVLSSGPIAFGNPGRPAWLECDAGTTILTYTPSSGTAVTLDYGGDNVTPIDSVARPGIFGCVLRGPGGTQATLGQWGTTIGVADGPNLYAQNIIDGVTIQGFNVGYQYNYSGSFENVLEHSNVGFNNIGIFITNGANSTENNRIVFNNISDNIYGVEFGSMVGGGDWYIDHNSFDTNGCITVSSVCPSPPMGAALFIANATNCGGSCGSQYLHVAFNENHIEDNLGGVFQDMLQISGGLVDIVGDTFAIDNATGGTELIAASTATLDILDIQMHGASVYANLVKFTGGANGNIGTVATNAGEFTSGIYTSSGGGSICVSQPALPQFTCQYEAATQMTLQQTGGSATILNSGGFGSSISLVSGTGGILLNGPLQNFGATCGGSSCASNSYTATIPITQQGRGTLIFVEFTNGNTFTGTTMLNVNTLGSMNITKNGTTSLVSGDLKVSEIVPLMSDGTHWQIVGAAAVP
jgi:hypothetical protein